MTEIPIDIIRILSKSIILAETQSRPGFSLRAIGGQGQEHIAEGFIVIEYSEDIRHSVKSLVHFGRDELRAAVDFYDLKKMSLTNPQS